MHPYLGPGLAFGLIVVLPDSRLELRPLVAIDPLRRPEPDRLPLGRLAHRFGRPRSDLRRRGRGPHVRPALRPPGSPRPGSFLPDRPHGGGTGSVNELRPVASSRSRDAALLAVPRTGTIEPGQSGGERGDLHGMEPGRLKRPAWRDHGPRNDRGAAVGPPGRGRRGRDGGGRIRCALPAHIPRSRCISPRANRSRGSISRAMPTLVETLNSQMNGLLDSQPAARWSSIPGRMSDRPNFP